MTRTTRARLLFRASLALILAGCAAAPIPPAPTPTAQGPTSTPTPAPTPTIQASPSAQANAFPTARFAALGDAAVAPAMATELQGVLETSADGDGLTATVISPAGTWSGATGFAARDRAMIPNDQMSIGHITQTIVAAEVMQLVEAGRLGLDDLAADRIPPGLGFETNGATIADLLSHRSGFPETLSGPGEWESLTTNPTRAWTPEEVLMG